MEQEKKCKNCKFFKMHYVKSTSIFMAINQGHCMNDEIHWNIRKNNMPCENVCEKWESNEDKKKEEKERIETVLKSMRTNLIHIEKILKDDL